MKSVLLALTVLIALALQHGSLSAGDKKENGTEKTAPATVQENGNGKVATPTVQEKASFIDIYSLATILPKQIIDLKNQIEQKITFKAVEQELPKFTDEVEKIRWDTTIAQTDPGMQMQQVAGLQGKAQKVALRLEKLGDEVTAKISTLSGLRKNWMDKKERVVTLDTVDEIQWSMVAEQHEKVLETIDQALGLIEENLKKALLIGKRIGDLQIVVYSTASDLQELDEYVKLNSTQQTAPSMLSAEFYSQINLNLLKQSIQKTRQSFADRIENLQVNIIIFLPLTFLFILLCLVINKTKNFVSSSSRWYIFAKCPFATAVFMVSTFSALYNLLPFDSVLLDQWRALLHIVNLVAVVRLIKYVVVDKEKQNLLKRLTLFLLVTLVLLVLEIPGIVISLYVFYASIVALAYYFYLLPSTKGKKISEIWVKRLWGIFPAIILVSGITGYDQFAIMIYSTLLSSVIVGLVVWMLYLMHLGLLEMTLNILPFSLLKDNTKFIIEGLRPILIWLHLFILVIIQCVIWDVYPTVNVAVDKIVDLGFNLGGLHVSPKFVFTVVFVFYGALLASRAVQVVLLKRILPRYKVERGVQLSITRLVHYAIVTVGFFIMLKVLGFQLSQLTLLGGALGVGIGFGLQAIVSNFVSGLILLFERPLKVGDTIQVGAEWGEVKQLGLRATIIETFDNAEIVVPNSDLITGQVTNWTLANRKVRVKVPVGVAYGTDVTKVLEILIGCGKANPMVLDKPQPNALFLAFGASSLDFELRVWIPEFLDKLQVLSDLNQDIDNEFALNGIEIPFPQSDLHLRSVDEAAGAKLRGEMVPVMPKAPG